MLAALTNNPKSQWLNISLFLTHITVDLGLGGNSLPNSPSCDTIILNIVIQSLGSFTTQITSHFLCQPKKKEKEEEKKTLDLLISTLFSFLGG